jgi:hypothetical protein
VVSCSTRPSALGLAHRARAVPPAYDVATHNGSNGAFVPVDAGGSDEAARR